MEQLFHLRFQNTINNMATNYPNSKQTFTNPGADDLLTNPSHSDLHANMNDTVEAIQDDIGYTNSKNYQKKLLFDGELKSLITET